MQTQLPDAQAFIDDIQAVYRKHKLGLNYSDNGLEVVELEDYILEYLQHAEDNRVADAARRAASVCIDGTRMHSWAAGTDPMRCVWCGIEGPSLPGRR